MTKSSRQAGKPGTARTGEKEVLKDRGLAGHNSLADEPAATLVYGNHPVHGLGWTLTYDLQSALRPDDHFIPGGRDDFERALRTARTWLAQQPRRETLTAVVAGH